MKKVLALLLSLTTPSFLLADPNPELEPIVGIFASLREIVANLIPVAFGAAVLFFFWGLAKYILAAGDAAKVADGRRIMIWGTLAIFVAASIWGLVAFIRNTTGITDIQSVGVPGIQGF